MIRTDSLVGSVHYLAPEVLSMGSYDVMADWWSYGVLLYDMFVCNFFDLFFDFYHCNIDFDYSMVFLLFLDGVMKKL